MRKKKKPVKEICRNCKLFNPARSVCSVVVLYEGQRLNIPVDPEDSCFFEQTYFDPILNKEETLNDIKQVRFWVEDKDGKKTDKDGKVLMEFDNGFFGDLSITDIV
jgi:hypothetical protein